MALLLALEEVVLWGSGDPAFYYGGVMHIPASIHCI